MADRVIPASDRHPGLIEIERDGRFFQINSDAPEARMKLEEFAAARLALTKDSPDA